MNHEKASRLDFIIATVALLLLKYVYQNKCVVSESGQKCGCLCYSTRQQCLSTVCRAARARQTRKGHDLDFRLLFAMSDFFSFLLQTKQQFRILYY